METLYQTTAQFAYTLLENKRHDHEKGIFKIDTQLGKYDSSPPQI
jgi:hypothetical protein